MTNLGDPKKNNNCTIHRFSWRLLNARADLRGPSITLKYDWRKPCAQSYSGRGELNPPKTWQMALCLVHLHWVDKPEKLIYSLANQCHLSFADQKPQPMRSPIGASLRRRGRAVASSARPPRRRRSARALRPIARSVFIPLLHSVGAYLIRY